ncbi:TIR domain-containing protein [Polymorphobacter arshaanensis]|uniref:TIR domain-containing protein n=1 Tax=Glacieibacterium arshaanense TaxID=2511025 RepID=A0A4Y9EQ45_9SPHN|nr:TIR domain-containing protein [Polymorphobacter arshaanensis]TFU05480.1 TIR domain-containing protein [Polymorphobacter arshaanensis]
MVDVFVSYKAEDRARVAPLVKALQAEGLSLWWDAHIGGGDDWRASIESNLEAARVVIVVWSTRSVGPEGRFVRDEATWAQRRGAYLPVRIDAVDPPLGFGEIQALQLSGWKGARSDARYKAVLAAVRARTSGEALVALAPVPLPAKGLDRRLLLGGGGALLAAGAGFGAWRMWGGNVPAGAISIAVLPFTNLSVDPEQAYFSDGLAEELRTTLARIPEVKVIGRVSSEKFRDADDLKDVAAQLGVDTVLTGSVRKSPSKVRISAQLIDGKTSVERWSDSFDRAPGDVIAIQSSIATAVAAALSTRIGSQIGRQLSAEGAGGTGNAEAQALFLKQRQLGLTGDGEDIARQRIALLDAALALDPDYADAIANKSVLVRFYGNPADPQAARAAARTLIKRAVTVAPQSAYVRIINASGMMFDGNIKGSVAEADAALKLNSNDVRVLAIAARLIGIAYPARGATLARAGLTRDPFNANSQAALADTLTRDRQYREALTAADAALALSNGSFGWTEKIAVLLATGDFASARIGLPQFKLDWQRYAATAVIEARTGSRAASDAAVAALDAINNDRFHYQLAQIHAQRGEKALALASLDKALATHDSAVQFSLTDPLLDPLRREPRFRALVAELFPADAVAAMAKRLGT